MKENSSKKLKNNLFYDCIGSRWIKKETPCDTLGFIECLRSDSSLCPDDEKMDNDKVSEYYKIYINSMNKLEIPNYKKSRGSLFFGFTRTNASIKFYLDRCYLEEHAKKELSNRQNTVSLESFISKYGPIEGQNRFNEYREKWKKTISKYDKKDLYSKWKNIPENYLNKINHLTGLNYTLEESEIKIKKDLGKGFKKVWEEYRAGKREKSILNTTIEYYLSKGLTTELAAIELKKRQATFSLEKCIQKHGKVKGIDVFNKRNSKWLDTLNSKDYLEKKDILLRKTRNLPRFSRESKDFFDSLIGKADKILPNGLDVFYGSNEMILWDHVRSRPYFYDFAIPKYKIIIEYNGSAFHPNYSILSEEQIEKWACPYTKQNAVTKHKIDQDKINFAKSLGYALLVVWDTDQYDQKLDACLKFIITNIKN
jgi:hypothetical protein